MPVITTAILVSALSIALAVIFLAIMHLKRPSRSSAMRLAAASSAVVCFLWPASAGSSGVGLLSAILLYILVLRPAAKASFRDERNA
jgi:hypothetical protein